MTPYQHGYKIGRTGVKPSEAVIPWDYTTDERMDFWEGYREARQDVKDMQRDPWPTDDQT